MRQHAESVLGHSEERTVLSPATASIKMDSFSDRTGCTGLQNDTASDTLRSRHLRVPSLAIVATIVDNRSMVALADS